MRVAAPQTTETEIQPSVVLLKEQRSQAHRAEYSLVQGPTLGKHHTVTTHQEEGAVTGM